MIYFLTVINLPCVEHEEQADRDCLCFFVFCAFLLLKNKSKESEEKKMRARTFNVMQYEFNPKTGEDLHFNESNIIKALEHKSIKKWAYICHDKDVYSAKDEEEQGYKQPLPYLRESNR